MSNRYSPFAEEFLRGNEHERKNIVWSLFSCERILRFFVQPGSLPLRSRASVDILWIFIRVPVPFLLTAVCSLEKDGDCLYFSPAWYWVGIDVFLLGIRQDSHI